MDNEELLECIENWVPIIDEPSVLGEDNIETIWRCGSSKLRYTSIK